MLALSVGAAVAAAMLSVYYDGARKMSRELRAYGANVMLAPAAGQEFIPQQTLSLITGESWSAEVASSAPFLYVVAVTGSPNNLTTVVVTGTWVDAARAVSPWWKIDGSWIDERNDSSHCLVGARLARQLGVGIGRNVVLGYGGTVSTNPAETQSAVPSGQSQKPKESSFEVAGILSTGGDEEDQVLVSLAAAQKLSGLTDQLSSVEVSAIGDTGHIEALATQMNARLPGVRADLVRQISEAEGRVLGKLRLMMLLVTVLMLGAASLSVTTTLAALVMERRKEIGTMKALGANPSELFRLFLFELTTLGLAGGIAGYLVGIVVAQPMGRSLFGVGVTPRFQVFAAVIGISLVVALISGIIPLKRMREVQPALILKGE